jgi:uncharacterized SAM-binding protein YcdF (DUF218 family)
MSYKSYLASLPIPREAESSQLTAADKAQIGRIVFIKSNPQPADLLFVFGTSTIEEQVLAQVAAQFQQGFYPWIMVTGKIGRIFYETSQPLAHVMRDKFISLGIPAEKILVQDRSTNTVEDVKFGLKILAEHKIRPQRIAFLCKAHHSGRCLLTMRKFFPDQALFPITYTAVYDSIPVSPETWPEHPIARSRAYGEYLRILKYSARGDIAPFE